MNGIEHITLHRLRVPLREPYVLSIGTVRVLDTVLVEAHDTRGETGYGEATVLSGYTHETSDGTWSRVQELASAILGLDPAPALDRLAPHTQDAPFTVTALATAVEILQGIEIDFPRPRTIPLVALIKGRRQGDLEAEIENYWADGYRTFKIKVGFGVVEDLERVGLIQRLNAARARLRIDANQGYSREEALHFAAALEPDGIELLEQTCDAGDWDAAVAVARAARVPMMLDESIYGPEDVERAAELGAARFIKFKLMKAGGLARLKDALARIRALGMTPVLGNGVAADVGCWLETVACAAWLDNAGEMNGFLKTARALVVNPLRVHGGAIQLPAHYRPEIAHDRVEQYRTDLVELGGNRPAARTSGTRS